jgi:pseudouridine kinase
MIIKPFIAVIGGITMDILAFPSGHLVRGDSSPGRVSFSPGGVGRNIAENLARLSVPVSIFSVIGDDSDGRALVASCEKVGIDGSRLRIIQGERTSAYVSILDETGETEAGIAAMDICSRMIPALVDEWADGLERASCIVIDANLPAETIAYAARRFAHIPIVLDPVSETKTPRATEALPFLHAIKPNREEAGVLCGFPIRDREGLERASRVFHERGTKRVFISLGADGAYCSDAENPSEAGIFPAVEAPCVDTTGAGDAFTAGIAYGVLNALSLSQTAHVALALSALTMGTRAPVNPDLSASRLAELLASNRVLR